MNESFHAFSICSAETPGTSVKQTFTNGTHVTFWNCHLCVYPFAGQTFLQQLYTCVSRACFHSLKASLVTILSIFSLLMS